MAKGDIRAGVIPNVPSNGYAVIQPPLGEEWCIFKIFWEDAVEISLFDGSNDVLFVTSSSKGSLLDRIPITPGCYIRVKNVSEDPQDIGYSGYQTK